jgi:Cof subfamily protein (haloacid dehalogenase superfamily)
MVFMGFRVIALDLDGTTLDSKGVIRPRTKQAIATALDCGLDVVLVTGRHHITTRPFHAELGLSSSAICCNGTYVYDFNASQVIVGDPMTKDQARHMLEICRRHGVHCLVYSKEAMNFEESNAHMKWLCAWAESFPTEIRPDIRRVESFEQVIEEASKIWKFVVSHDDPDVLAAWRAEVVHSKEFSSEFSWTNRIDTVRAGNTKGTRLLEWAEARKIDPAEIVAFGDNLNDLSMIVSVGLGVAMGNGEKELKAAAARVIDDNNSDAIAETIERYVL